jgi:hypothetical protein
MFQIRDFRLARGSETGAVWTDDVAVEQQRMTARCALAGRRDALLTLSTEPRDVPARGGSRAIQTVRTRR